MSGEIALDTSVAIRFLNGDSAVTERVLSMPKIVLPVVVAGEFISVCIVVPLGTETARNYARTRLALKRKGRPIPMNDVWIAAQCLEYGWVLVTDDRDFDYVDGLLLEHG